MFNLLGTTEKKDVQEVTTLLEEYIVISAASNATPEDLTNIEHCLKQRNVSGDTIKENTMADLDFILPLP